MIAIGSAPFSTVVKGGFLSPGSKKFTNFDDVRKVGLGTLDVGGCWMLDVGWMLVAIVHIRYVGPLEKFTDFYCCEYG